MYERKEKDENKVKFHYNLKKKNGLSAKGQKKKKVEIKCLLNI